MKSNVPSHLTSLLILVSTLSVAAGVLTYSPTARAQSATCFQHSKGQFREVGPNSWREIYNGRATYSYVFYNEDNAFIYLHDQARNLNLALPKLGGYSRVQWGNGPWTNGYVVQQCSGTGTELTPNNGGPIASQTCVSCLDRCVDARVQCIGSVCQIHGGYSNGPNACTQITRNQDTFGKDLGICSQNEVTCKNQCQAAGCN